MTQGGSLAPRVLTVALCLLGRATVFATTSESNPAGTFKYVFQIDSTNNGPVAFSGEFQVDGQEKVIPRAVTPYEFRCEAAKSLKGHFDSLQPDHEIRVKAYLQVNSRKKVAGKAKGSRVGIELKGESSESKDRQQMVLWGERGP